MAYGVLSISSKAFLDRTSPSQIGMLTLSPHFITDQAPTALQESFMRTLSSQSHSILDGAIDAMTAAVNPRGMQPSEVGDPAASGPPSPPYSFPLPAPARHTECHDVSLESQTAMKTKPYGRVIE